MTRTNPTFAITVFTIALMARSVIASEPKVPLPPDGTPYDWQCVYPYTETSCEELIALWARDHLEDPTKVSEDVVGCGNCTEIKATDSEGSQWIVGYRCNNRHGYAIVADDLQAKIPLYRKGDSRTGWSVNDWALYRCMRTWQCYDHCTWDRGEPVCFVVQVVGIGRFQPVLGSPCGQGADSESDPEADESPMPGSENPRGTVPGAAGSDSSDGTDSSGHWY